MKKTLTLKAKSARPTPMRVPRDYSTITSKVNKKKIA